MKTPGIARHIVLALIAIASFATIAQPYYFPSEIEYTQYLTKIISEEDVDGWPLNDETAKRYITNVVVSAAGSKIAFIVRVNHLAHLFVAHPDGSNLQDLTNHFSETFRYWPIQLNDNGTRVFCGQGEEISYCDLNSSPECYLSITDGIWNYDYRKPYSINSDGSTMYFKHDAGWDPVNMRYNRGLYYADVPGSPIKIMDIDQLPCDSECGNMNMLAFLGASADGSTLLFAHNRHYYDPPATGMWKTVFSSSPFQVPAEYHDYVWSTQNINNHIISANGTKALFHCGDGLSNEIHTVSLISGEKVFIAYGSPDHWVALSPDGTYARITTVNHNATVVNLNTNPITKRDTGSYFIEEFSCGYHLSDLTGDNNFYFMSGSCPNHKSKVYRVEMNPTSTGGTPDISDIRFSEPRLLHTEGATIAVTVRVFDPEVHDDRESIEWVRLSTLVEGKERPDWPMARPPLAFPTGDPAFAELYDDGEQGNHGDLLAGDGVYTFDKIATRKGNYDSDNSWYSHYTLPHAVGIRIIAKDSSGNYGIADTSLMIGDVIMCVGDFDSDHDVDGADLFAYLSNSGSIDIGDFARYIGRTNCR